MSGMDGTAGRQFSTLRRRLQRLGIELVLTTLPRDKCVPPAGPAVHVLSVYGCCEVPAKGLLEVQRLATIVRASFTAA